MSRQHTKKFAAFLAIGFVATALIAWISALVVNLRQQSAVTVNAFDGRVHWTVQLNRHLLGMRITSTREAALAWSPQQALGPPDSASGDQRTAWASAGADSGAEWLELDFPSSLRPAAIQIHQNDCPGTIVKVTCFNDSGQAAVVWQGKAAPASQPIMLPSVLKIPVAALPFPTRRVRIDLDSAAVPGWNEIDAVALQGANGALTWASAARASSTYAAIQTQGDAVTPALPRWAGLFHPTPDFASGRVRTEQRTLEARGFPVPALFGEVDDSSTTPRLPYRPIWSGLAIDTILFALLAAAIAWLFTHPGRVFIEASRMRRGCCLRCGYDLQYDFVAGCPECGWRRKPA